VQDVSDTKEPVKTADSDIPPSLNGLLNGCVLPSGRGPYAEIVDWGDDGEAVEEDGLAALYAQNCLLPIA
jgi:hypothetical protein